MILKKMKQQMITKINTIMKCLTIQKNMSDLLAKNYLINLSY